MYDIKKRNSVLSLFNGIEVDKFPDESFEYEMNLNDDEEIYKRDFSETNLVCNLFNKVEKHIRSNDKYITRVVFKCTVLHLVKIQDLESIINIFVELLGNDEMRSGEFTEEDAQQFEKGSWVGRYWSTSLTKGVSLIINRNVDYFELHITFQN